MFSERVDQNNNIVKKLNKLFPHRVKIYNDILDESIIATINLLIGQRYPDEEFDMFAAQYEKIDNNKVNIQKAKDDIKTTIESNGQANVLYVAYSFDKGFHYNDKEDFYTDHENNVVFTEEEGWTELEDVDAYFSDAFPTRIFVNKELKSTVIFLHILTNRVWHALQGAISRLMPLYFEGYTDHRQGAAYAYLDSLTKYEYENYVMALENLFNESIYQRQWQEYALKSMFDSMYSAKCNTLERELASLNKDINTCFDKISELQRKVFDKNCMLMGLKCGNNAETDALVQYMNNSKEITLDNTDEEYVQFTIENTLQTWIEETAETHIVNPRNDIYRNGIIKKHKQEDIRNLMKAIFIDNKYKIKMKSAFRYNLISGSVEVINRETEYEGPYMFNPHLKYNICLGGYRSPIQKCLTNGDILGAIEYSKAAVGSLNLEEYASFHYFVRDIDQCTKPILRTKDDRIITVNEAIEEIKNEQKNETDGQ